VLLLIAGSLSCAAHAAAADRPAKDLYVAKCALCHGRNGQPNPAMAQARVPDFTSPQFHDQRSDAALRASIDNGKAGTLMRGFKGELSEAERSALVKHVRSLRKDAPAQARRQGASAAPRRR
jgi:cytochrome c553